MSGLDLVVDTNIFVYLTAGNKNVYKLIHGNNLTVSFISEMELLSWPSIGADKTKILKKILEQCKVISLNDEIKHLAIELRKKFRIKLPDAIVAATSIYLDTPLLSADQEFKKITDLKLILINV